MAPVEDHPSVPESVPKTSIPDFGYEDLKKGDRIGTGGNADVYEATVDRDGETYAVAVKKPRFEGTLQQRVVEDFLSEAETWAKLDNHENVVSIHAWGASPLPWLALEYMDSGTLSTRVGTAGTAEALWLSGRIVEGVRHGHRHGIAHLDLKPSNILLRQTDPETWPYPKVSDWGLAKLLLDHSGSVEGISPSFAAPEQFDADEYGRPDDITDIYQLGAVVYTLVTGEPPFSGSATAVMQSVLTDSPRPPSELNSDLPEAADEVLLTALAKRKEDRYEGALPFRKKLNRLFKQVVASGDGDSYAATVTTRFEQDELESGSDSLSRSSAELDDTASESQGEDSAQSSDEQNRFSRRRAPGLLGTGAVGAGIGIFAALQPDLDESELSIGAQPTEAPTTTTDRPPTPTATEQSRAIRLEEIWTRSDLDESAGSNVEAWLDGDSILIGRHKYDTRHHLISVRIDGTVVWDAMDIPRTHSVYKSSVATDESHIVVGLPRESRYTFNPPDNPPDIGALVRCYDPDSGTLDWEFETDTGADRFFLTSLNLTENGVVTVVIDGRTSDVGTAVYGIDIDTGERLWKQTDLHPDRTTERVEDSIPYQGHCVLSGFYGLQMLDDQSGEVVKHSPEPRYPYFDIAQQGQFIYGTDTSVAVKFDLDRFESVWETELSSGTGRNCHLGSNFVFTDDRDGYVYAFDQTTGEEVWRQRVQGTSQSMALTSEHVWVSDSNRAVRAYDFSGERVFEPATFATETAAADERIPLGGWEDSVFIGGTPPARYQF